MLPTIVHTPEIDPCWSLYTTGVCATAKPCRYSHDIDDIDAYIHRISTLPISDDYVHKSHATEDITSTSSRRITWADEDDDTAALDFPHNVLATLAELKDKYIRDFHRPCTFTSGSTSATNIDTAFDTCAEFTNYVRADFITSHFSDLVPHPVVLGNVGGSLGGSQRRDKGVHLDVSTTDHMGNSHCWTLEFIILDKLPYEAFIGSTAITGPVSDFFFSAANWARDDMYIAHEFPDANDAPEDDGPPPGLFPADYFNVLTAANLRESFAARISPEFLLHSPSIIDDLLAFESTWINDYRGLQNIPTMQIQWRDDTPAVLRSHTQRYAPALLAPAEQEFKKLMDIGFMRYSKSTFLSPLTVAPKKTAPFVRLCGNYKKANDFMINRNLRIPLVRQEINKCLPFSIFAELDWRNAYHQIPLHTDDIPRLALQTMWGNVEPLFLWEGVKSASDLMEHAKNSIFEHDDFADWTVALFDNILVLATDTNYTRVNAMVTILNSTILLDAYDVQSCVCFDLPANAIELTNTNRTQFSKFFD